METMLRFVGRNLGVAIVPLALAETWAPFLGLRILPFRGQGFQMPRWKLVILVRSQRQKLAGRTVQDLMLEALKLAPKLPDRDNTKKGRALIHYIG